MNYLNRIIAIIFISTFILAMSIPFQKIQEKNSNARRYLRVSLAHWDINVYSSEAEQIFRQIETDGVAVFKAQPGFIRYRLMRADSTTTIAVAEWESEQLGLAGAENYRSWMRSVGIMSHIKLETYTGDIVAGS
jgi:heme-degrading monooxygenase HmoA